MENVFQLVKKNMCLQYVFFIKMAVLYFMKYCICLIDTCVTYLMKYVMFDHMYWNMLCGILHDLYTCIFGSILYELNRISFYFS